jgi:RHS repeat-associated protein
MLEKMTNATATAYRYYVPAGSSTVVYNRWSNGTNAIYYMSQDNLGSTAAITDKNAALVVKEKFAAVGFNENSTAEQATMATVSRHEFTGQEGLDNAGLWMVNLNGRVLVPSGSFLLSPDPFVQDPTDTRSYNRYAYVEHNPLSMTDPTGYFSLGDLLNPFSNDNPLNPFGHVGRALALSPFTSAQFGKRLGDDILRKNTWLQPIAEIAACYFSQGLGCAAASAYITRLNGGSIDQALIAGLTSYASSAASGYVDSLGLSEWANVPIEGTISGTVAAANGGSFKTGFLLGAGTEAAYGIYKATSGYDPSWEPGGAAHAKDPSAADFEPANPAWNNVGTHTLHPELQSGQWWPLTEGSVLSNVLNEIPGFNSFSVEHDFWMYSVPRGWLHPIANIPLMIPALAVNYAALLNEVPLCASRNGLCK